MPLPLTASCFSKIQIGFTFLVPAHPVVPDKGALNVCVCVVFADDCRVSAHKMLKLCSSEAYLLFYERQDQQQQPTDTPFVGCVWRSSPRTQLAPKANGNGIGVILWGTGGTVPPPPHFLKWGYCTPTFKCYKRPYFELKVRRNAWAAGGS